MALVGTEGDCRPAMKKRPENDSQLGPPLPPSASVEGFEASRSLRCRVCGNPGASKRYDVLCWVCRHLKISAWKDVEKLSFPD